MTIPISFMESGVRMVIVIVIAIVAGKPLRSVVGIVRTLGHAFLGTVAAGAPRRSGERLDDVTPRAPDRRLPDRF